MKNMPQQQAACNKYERRPSLEALIRRMCHGDRAAADAAMLYARRLRFEDSLWTDKQGPWIAQPMRCFADELDVCERQAFKTNARLEGWGLIEVQAEKLYRASQRKITRLRLTPVFRLFLHRIGWWRDTAQAAVLEVEVGARTTALMDQQEAHLCTIGHMYLCTIGHMYLCTIGQANGVLQEGTSTLPFGEPPNPQNLTGPILPSEEDKSPPDPPAEPTMAFQGATPRNKPTPVKKTYGSVAEAAAAVLSKPPKEPKGEKVKLWVSVAQVIHKAAKPFPLKGPPDQMARLWKLRMDLQEEYPDSPGLLYDVVAAAAGDWDSFAEWMIANSSQAKSVPASFDLMWLQYHRQKAVEYTKGPGAAVCAMVLTGKVPVQTTAQPGTNSAAAGWKIV